MSYGFDLVPRWNDDVDLIDADFVATFTRRIQQSGPIQFDVVAIGPIDLWLSKSVARGNRRTKIVADQFMKDADVLLAGLDCRVGEGTWDDVRDAENAVWREGRVEMAHEARELRNGAMFMKKSEPLRPEYGID